MFVTVLLLRLCVGVHSIGNPKEVMPCSYQGIFLLPHLTSNCLFPKERIIHELMDLTGPNTGHTSQYCTASVPPDIGTSLHPDETVSCSRWKFPLVLRLPGLGRVGSQMGILAEVTITLPCSFKFWKHTRLSLQIKFPPLFLLSSSLQIYFEVQVFQGIHPVPF